MDTLLTVKAAANRLIVHPVTLQAMLRDGRVKGFKIGRAWRVPESELQRLARRVARD